MRPDFSFRGKSVTARFMFYSCGQEKLLTLVLKRTIAEDSCYLVRNYLVRTNPLGDTGFEPVTSTV